MYGGYAWLTNQVPPVLPLRRLLLILGMAAFLICALAIPSAFGGGGVAFGLGYLLVVLVHAGLYASVHGRTMAMWVGPFNLVAALSIIAAGLLGGPGAYALWVAAILVQFVMPYANRSPARPDIQPAHFVERHGLLLLIALGESIVAIGIGAGHEALSFRLFGTVLLGLGLAAALWWSYFASDEERAERALESVASLNQRLLLAVRAYFFAYVPMLLGIIALSAGVKLSIGEVTHRLDPGPALTLAAGVALFLAGDVAFRRALGIGPLAYRAAAAAVALATAVLGIYAAAAVQLVALIAVLLGMLAPEARWRGAMRG
jgi:low temperature requirement protein LtrA